MTEVAAGSVVIVDDSDIDFEAFSRALTTVAPESNLIRFESGGDLLEHQLTGLPIVVLLDLNLPGENGLRTLHRLRSNPSWRVIPVVIYSGSTRHADIGAAYAAGAAGYLVKPLDPNKLIPLAAALWTWWAKTVQPPRALGAGTPVA